MTVRAVPGYERLLEIVLAAAIVGGPLGYLVGGAFSPAVHVSGEATIAAYAEANPLTNALHIAAFVVASFLLPIGAVGLAFLAYDRTPWLATIGGLLGVAGWLPFSALAALDDLVRAISHQPYGESAADLLDRFTTDVVMSVYLIVYIVCHLVAYVLLGLALRRARVVPWWGAWSLIASSPVTIVAFALPGDVGSVALAIGVAGLALLLIGSLPAGRAMAVRHRLQSRHPESQ
ncbi:MAG: hypothetical protein GEV03_28715 [Streptosporangiales bacterium]|nr:hypothetical protein [Streptosporangiales bacterium]